MANLDSKQEGVYRGLKLLQPIMLPALTDFQMTFANPNSAREFVFVCNDKITHIDNNADNELLQKLFGLYESTCSSIDTRSLQLEIQKLVTELYVLTKDEPDLWEDLDSFTETKIVGQRLFGLRDNIEAWSRKMSTLIPKNR